MTAACENPEDAAVFLQELREISNKHSIYSNHSKPSNQKLRPQTCSSSGKENSDNPIIDSKCGDIDGNNFLNQTPENRELNQYWYSKNTIKALCDTIRESLTVYEGKRVAFLSTPSLFFSLTAEEREYCTLFDVSYTISITTMNCRKKSNSNQFTINFFLPCWFFSLILHGNPAQAITFMITTIQPTSKTITMGNLTWL